MENLPAYIRTLLDSHASETQIIQSMSLKLSELIEHDFSAFVQLLYRLDISEKHFQAHKKIAVEEIARIILNRELQKRASRNKGTKSKGDWKD